MIKKKISNIMDNIDEKYINEAMEYEMLKPEAKGQWMKWGIMAACLTIVILAGAIVLPSLGESGVSKQRMVTLEEMNRPYRDLEVEKISYAFGTDFLVGGIGMESGWPAEYLTLAERTDSLAFNKTFYEMHGWADESLIGELLGGGECKIYDSGTLRGQKNVVGTETFEVYELSDVSEKLMVAVKIEGEFWLFKNRYQELETFGDWMNVYNLSEHLELKQFAIRNEENQGKCFEIEDDSEILNILFACKDAEYIGNTSNGLVAIDFEVTIEQLEMYKKIVRITNEGYLWTNLFSGTKAFFIGEDAAAEIISYATENKVETEYETYRTECLVGYIEEIAEDYILVNDGILCENRKDGISFKISLEDIKVRRCVECLMKEGDLIWIDFRGQIDTKEDNFVYGVFEIGKAVILDGTKQIINGEGDLITQISQCIIESKR